MSDLEETLAFQIRALKLPEPQREVAFAPPRKFRADFLWPDLIVEVEGGIYTGGQHVRGTGVERNCEKSALATILGYRYMRVTGHQVEDGRAVAWIEQALR